jgi:hypothetical protein
MPREFLRRVSPQTTGQRCGRLPSLDFGGGNGDLPHVTYPFWSLYLLGPSDQPLTAGGKWVVIARGDTATLTYIGVVRDGVCIKLTTSEWCQRCPYHSKFKMAARQSLLRRLALALHAQVYSQTPVVLGVLRPHVRMHRQADEACPRAAHKTGAYRNSASSPWQRWCRRQAH